MIKELVQTIVSETTLNVSMSQIDAVRRKSITRSGCRIYKDGCIGISGTLGEATDETWAQAEANLALRVPYKFSPETTLKRTRDLRKLELSDEAFISQAEEVLAELRRHYPDFIFSNKVSMTETAYIMRNDAGLDLMDLDKSISFGLLVKHKDSVSIFDTGLMRQDRVFDKGALLEDAKAMLGCFNTEKQLPAGGKILMVMSADQLKDKFAESLNGEAVARGASLFCGKTGEAVFNPLFSLDQDRSSEKMHVPFFDAEGVSQPEDRFTLIESGVIAHAYSDKKNAGLLGEPTSGAASGAYDETPALGSAPLTMRSSGKTLSELLGCEPAALAVMASGGDYTGQGDYASPVQLGMLIENGRITGRLPEFNMRGNLFELFGSDFVGISSDRPLFGEHALVVRMAVS